MKSYIKLTIEFLILILFLLVSACNVNQAETKNESLNTQKTISNTNSEQQEIPAEKSNIPNLQTELLNGKNATTNSMIGDFDFKNFTYPLPRGWQDVDSKDVTLENGKRKMTEERIGMEYVTTKYFDVTGDGNDEAFVVLKVETGGAAIPQTVYIYQWKDENPELLWYFRTGDRADGGLKNLYEEDSELVVELFGRDRYLFNQMETSKIVGDEQQLCCPTHFTRTRYKQEGNNFKLEGDRWTYSLKDENEEPIKNMNELKLQEERGS